MITGRLTHYNTAQDSRRMTLFDVDGADVMDMLAISASHDHITVVRYLLFIFA